MASNEILDDDEDDQEFDWEAAVREIDIACHTTNPNPSSSSSTVDSLLHQLHTTTSTSTSTSLETDNSITLCSNNNNNNTDNINTHQKQKPTSCRQSTLDQFIIGKSLLHKFPLDDPPREREPENIDERGLSLIHIDADAAKTWIYPVNVPVRDYQFSITRTALFSNTLVALPTGLGKTLIAAVVMYNYFRWFPEGKIVFAAPSRPLVMQQIEACHNIVGIPQEWTVDMTGQTTPARRACLWIAKRVFFVTPQVLERDIQSGTCLVKNIVCLVIDEAHRALGNYSYCVAVREMMAVPVQLRLLALSATPGSKQQTIQHIIDNLQISTLEYRSESDPDVSPYVHDRKIELIEVPVGRDAVEVNNLLLEVIRPFVARLCAFGVLQNRDFRTLSPCDLLNSRDKFREAPPLDVPQLKYGEVESYFGLLMTLYHIRKLLSSHGIRPAFEMLEEKLQQRSFARLMGRNEVIWKAKLIMQKSLSHGAPSPKLSKMLEVLVDHFKMRDPQNSRVIIFTNFRGSVRDIMEALANIGEFVKATQFIGQSSGKALKGQTQKVQQAVLEKFRAGGYNVIVATSIGEEGLDIMEVDLVICFDANISALRMIQRMGRTGRKHDGRVVVLACEGSELKGYVRKQANSKSIKKHMRNGGMNSFNFHSSPRMIPHIYKPEVQLVELSIEQFVPRGGKIKDDHPSQTPSFKTKLSDAETGLIAKYFPPTRDNTTWRPSLIAFPHFQAVPSRVQKVKHSLRTGMLIETMLCLQGLSFCRDRNSHFVEEEMSADMCLRVESVEHHDNSIKEVQSLHNLTEVHAPRGESNSVVFSEISRTLEKNGVPGFRGQHPPIHSYLFGSDFVSIDALGRVLVVSVPLLPLKEVSHSRPGSVVLVKSCLDQDFLQRVSLRDDKQGPMQTKSVSDLTAPTCTKCTENKSLLSSRLCNSHSQVEKVEDGAERSLQTLVSRGSFSYEGNSISEIPNFVKNKPPILLADEYSSEFRDIELSPRLSNFIKSGLVPESPMNDTGISIGERKREFGVSNDSPSKFHTEQLLKSSLPDQNEKTVNDGRASEGDVSSSAVNYEIQNSLVGMQKFSPRVRTDALPIIEEIQTPLANLSNNSCSKDWLLSSGDNSESVEQEHKFRRLRKYDDLCKRRLAECDEENIGPMEDLAKACAATSHVPIRHDRGKKPLEDVRVFIEEEVEVSSEVAVSDDEEDEQHNVSCDSSFIDDRIDLTAGSTQAEARSDMMTIYRRSLLSQSPMERLPSCFIDLNPDSVAPKTRKSEMGSTSEIMNHPNLTPQTVSESGGRSSVSIQLNAEKISSEVIPCTMKCIPRENESGMASRKRKLIFYQVGSVPACNLDEEFFLQSDEAAGIESFLQGQEEQIEANISYDDDKFYEGLDLDAVEEQAAKLLRYNSELVMQKKIKIPEPIPKELSVLSSPSFDLGI